MTYTDRNDLLKSDRFVGQVRIAFSDWLQYWAVNGTGSIEDPDLKQKTDMLIKMALNNPNAYVNKLATLAISEQSVKTASEVTDEDVQAAITDLLSNAIDYLM